ncbi:hypothetical protein ACFO9E_14705 [Streptomyces maoxianensis]|uniref:Tetratricopeptide repeat protein n=1 Tax=Streptomyces maoxianensis TaxID=1459942 RepID=A0ABV9G430_9ACTN
MTGRLLPALADLERRLELGDDDPAVHRERARVYLYLDRPEEALTALGEAAGDEQDANHLALLTRAHRRAGRFAPAREAAERLRTADPASFQPALTVSRTEGLAEVAELWRAADAELLVVACAQGDWPRADTLLAETPTWTTVADAADDLTELLACPGADPTELEPRLHRLTRARDAFSGLSGD